MKSPTEKSIAALVRVKPAATKVLAVSLMALTLAGCKTFDSPERVQSWQVFNASQRHPIIVKKSPSKINLSVPRGASGLSPRQRAKVSDFLGRFRASGAGNSKLVVSAPSGSPNEVAAMHAVADIRHLIEEFGFADDIVSVDAYHEEGDHQPPIRLSYLRFVAEAPECGDWSENVGENARNLHYPNFGCATQRNLASMVANPADLVEPRTMTYADARRRDEVFGKYIKGQSTVAQKQKDERARVKGEGN